MKDFIFKSIDEILQNGSAQLAVPLHQRAKFEGWLKIELAAKLQGQFGNTKLEPNYQYSNNLRADISSNGYLIELKTVNTNCPYNGSSYIRKPFSKNVSSVINDINKLRRDKRKGIIAFVIFPWNASCDANIDPIRNMLKGNNIVKGPATTQGLYIFVAEV